MILFPDPDAFQGDGVYSGYFVKLNGTGRYNVELEAFGTPSSSYTCQYTTQHNNVSDQTNWNVCEEKRSVRAFQRRVSLGSFVVKNSARRRERSDSIFDIFPPSRVNDLRVGGQQAHHRDETVTLNTTLHWTAPGDDFTEGRGIIINYHFFHFL